MVSSGEVESEYESELDGSVLLRRRMEASDDDEEVEGEENKLAVLVRLNASVWRIDDADESDDCEGAPEYYDDNVDEEASYVDELEKFAEQEESEEEVAEHVMATKQRGKEMITDGDKDAFAVPRIGAFYMHDDRFDGLRRIRYGQRRKKLWESKDESKWTHDKFEEMALEETHITELNAFQVPWTSNDYLPGRNKNNTKNGGFKAKQFRLHSKSGNDGSSSRVVKGRGPVRYKPLSRSISANPPMKRMQFEMTQGTNSKTNSARVFSANNKLLYERSLGKTANVDSGRILSTKGKQSRDTGMTSYTDPASLSFHGLNMNCDSLPFDQQLFAPSMSSNQQPFYHASSFHHHNFVAQRSMALSGTRNAVFPVSPNQTIHVPLANEFQQGNIAPLQVGSNITSSPRYTGILGDQNFNATPILLPGIGCRVKDSNFQSSDDISFKENYKPIELSRHVRRYGGPHHGSLGDPAIDMRSTGYSGQSQVHLRKT